MCTDGAGYVPCFMSLLIGEYYGEPRQSFGHSHGGKHVRTLLMEVRMHKFVIFVGWSESCAELNT